MRRKQAGLLVLKAGNRKRGVFTRMLAKLKKITTLIAAKAYDRDVAFLPPDLLKVEPSLFLPSPPHLTHTHTYTIMTE